MPMPPMAGNLKIKEFFMRNRFFYALLLLAFSMTTTAGEKLVVYNWSEYIPANALEMFSRETGIQVDYQTYGSNEEMYDKLKSVQGKGFDVIVPSTYYISRMQKEGLLQTIDLSRLKNFQHLEPGLLNRPFDAGNKFSIPYLWGSTGIAVNKARIDPASINTWQDLWDGKWQGRLLLIDNMREVFHMALAYRGYSTNTRASYEITSAYRLLKQLIPNVGVFESEAPRQPLLDGKADIGMIWSGEAVMAQAENPDITYIYPADGAAFWIDSFAIPSSAEHVENAHKFIDFMLRPEIAAKAVEELGYATPNATAKSSLDEEIRNNPVIFPPPEIVARGEFQQDLDAETTALMNGYWQELRHKQ